MNKRNMGYFLIGCFTVFAFLYIPNAAADPLCGHYPATYSFENDVSGQDPTNWIVDETGGPVNVNGSVDGHSKVIEIIDSGAANIINVSQNFITGRTNGTIEFWFRIKNASHELQLWIGNNGNIRVLSTAYNLYNVSTVSMTIIPGAGVVSSTWYHLRFDFECGSGGYQGLSADTYYLYLNGNKFGPFDFAIAATELNQLMYLTTIFSPTRAFIDAVGYSWDSDYDIGDNLFQDCPAGCPECETCEECPEPTIPSYQLALFLVGIISISAIYIRTKRKMEV